MFFFAWHRKDVLPPEKDYRTIKRIMHPLYSPEQSGFLINQNSLLYQSYISVEKGYAKNIEPYYHADGGFYVLSWARIDNKEELKQQLKIDSPQYHKISESELIALAFVKWGKSFSEKLTGDFACLVFDPSKHAVVCARDQLGVRPCYYYCSDEMLLCCTSASAIWWWLGGETTIELSWVAKYHLRLAQSFSETPYKGILKLPPSHVISVDGQGQPIITRYFDIQAIEKLEISNDADYVALYRSALEQAVKSRLVGDYPIGIESSGGIDSSSVLALAANFGDGIKSRLHTFTTAFSELEPELSLATSQEYQLPINHVITGAQSRTIATIRRGIELQGYPIEINIADMSESYYQIANKFNVKTMLSGFGGDEFVTCTRADVIRMELFSKGEFAKFLRIAPGNAITNLARLLKMWLRQQKTANFTQMGIDRETQSYKEQFIANCCLKRDVMETFNLEVEIDNIIHQKKAIPDFRQFILNNNWSPYIPTRLENCSLMAAGYNVEFSWPLLDLRLIQLMLSIPAEENCHKQYNRYLHRRAIDGLVPQKITWKKDKNMGSQVSGMGPFVQWDFRNLLFPLHSTLKDLIDQKKLEDTIRLIESLASSSDHKTASYRFSLQRSLTPVLYLNEWLTQINYQVSD